MAALPELGSADGRAGGPGRLLPFARDSGARSAAAGPAAAGQVQGGHVPGALSATGTGGLLTEFAERPARGKRAKVVLVAVARRMLVIANAIIRTGLLDLQAARRGRKSDALTLDSEHSRSRLRGRLAWSARGRRVRSARGRGLPADRPAPLPGPKRTHDR